ncbi:MAG: iron complex outermembrane receptor protein [Zhongshania sp.]|jgi:iron complex outermembrane receptor protein
MKTVIAIFALSLLSAQVLAQQPNAANTKSKKRVIEEVIVTANKTEQSVQDIPGSIQALTGEFLQKANVNDFSEFAGYMPNVMVTETPYAPEIAIRGMQSTGAGDNSVGLVIDDLVLSQRDFFSLGFFDLERIEVLRGPQGTLFGKSVTAGVVSLVTAAPTDEFSGNIIVRQGREDRQVQGAISGPLTDSLSARVGFIVDRPGSSSTNSFNGDQVGFVNRTAYRLKLLWRATDSTDVNVFFSNVDVKNRNINASFAKLTEGDRDYLVQFDPAIEDDAFDGQQSFDSLRQGDINDARLYGIRVDTDWGAPGIMESLSSTVVLGALEYFNKADADPDSSPADAFRTPISVTAGDMQQLEMRVQGTASGLFGLGSGNTELITGIFLQDEQLFTDYMLVGGEDAESYLAGPGFEAVTGIPGLPFTLPVGGLGGTLAGDGFRISPEYDASVRGIFMQMTYRPIDRLAITAGIRYDQIDRDAVMPVRKIHSSGNGELSVLGPAMGAEEDVTFTPEIREREDSAKVSVQYEFFDGNVVGYLTWARAFKGGAFNDFAVSEDDEKTVRPEFVEGWEAGFKNVLFDNSLVLNISVYDSEFTDLQVEVYFDDGIVPFVRLQNAASARTRGAEMDGMWLPSFAPWLTLSGSAAYSHARYLDYTNAPGGDLTGKTLVNAPAWSAVFTPEASLPLPQLGADTAITLGIDALYTSSYFTETSLPEEKEIAEKLLFNARLTLAPESGPWTLAFTVSNLSDEKYITQDGGEAGDLIWPNSRLVRVGDRRNTSLDFSWSW